MTDIKAIDLFCGAGGLTHGLIKAGISENQWGQSRLILYFI